MTAEETIIDYFKTFKVSYKINYIFNFGNNKIQYDFAIFNDYGTVKMLIIIGEPDNLQKKFAKFIYLPLVTIYKTDSVNTINSILDEAFVEVELW